jgi:hypothetical protein
MQSLSSSLPLYGCIIAITNFDPSDKSHLSSCITRLGGAYTRTFTVGRNTHLICNGATGPKYEEAMRQREGAVSDANRIVVKIVNAGWMEACVREKRRVDESLYAAIDEDGENDEDAEEEVDEGGREDLVMMGDDNEGRKGGGRASFVWEEIVFSENELREKMNNVVESTSR